MGNNIGDNGAKFISTAFQTNSSLTQLDLSSNIIGLNGAKFISTALQTNPSLAQLDLSRIIE